MVVPYLTNSLRILNSITYDFIGSIPLASYCRFYGRNLHLPLTDKPVLDEIPREDLFCTFHDQNSSAMHSIPAEIAFVVEHANFYQLSETIAQPVTPLSLVEFILVPVVRETFSIPYAILEGTFVGIVLCNLNTVSS
jgi:hypothetical protein